MQLEKLDSDFCADCSSQFVTLWFSWNLQKSNFFPNDSKVQVKPVTGEKLLSLTVGVTVVSYVGCRCVENKCIRRFLTQRISPAHGFVTREISQFPTWRRFQHLRLISVWIQSSGQRNSLSKSFYPYSNFNTQHSFSKRHCHFFVPALTLCTVEKCLSLQTRLSKHKNVRQV